MQIETQGWLGVILLIAPIVGSAQTPTDTAIKVSFGGFVDSYYAYDIGRPPTIDRSFFGGATFTTQPARHDEFNVNLAYVEVNLSGNRIHGRFALQAGTSVQSNYAAEPTVGTVSGPSLSRMIQEGFVGYQMTPTLWIDAGIFYSNAGLEGWASKDNPTYTRSLVADYSPYYSSGARVLWQATPKLLARLDVVNGWQNISETNSEKGVGFRLDYTATTAATLSYYNFFNRETEGRFRIFNGGGAKITSGNTSFLGEVDYGTMSAPSTGGRAWGWWGFTAIGKQQIAQRIGVYGRVERYDDPGQINITTGLPFPFRGNGASLGVDVTPQPRLWWRLEARGFFANDAIFPNGPGLPRKVDGFFVTSLALAL